MTMTTITSPPAREIRFIARYPLPDSVTQHALERHALTRGDAADGAPLIRGEPQPWSRSIVESADRCRRREGVGRGESIQSGLWADFGAHGVSRVILLELPGRERIRGSHRLIGTRLDPGHSCAQSRIRTCNPSRRQEPVRTPQYRRDTVVRGYQHHRGLVASDRSRCPGDAVQADAEGSGPLLDGFGKVFRSAYEPDNIGISRTSWLRPRFRTTWIAHG
jgi:hypothetical protein